MNLRLSFVVLMLAVLLSSSPALRSSFITASNRIRSSLFTKATGTSGGQLQLNPTKTISSTAAYSSFASTARSHVSEDTNTDIDINMATTGPEVPLAVPPTSGVDKVAQQSELPKLSAADFKLYNKLAVMMEYYHNHHRATWNTLYNACTNNRRPQGMSITQFLNLASQFTSQLGMHHDIEETHIFPILGRNMPMFRHAPGSNDKDGAWGEMVAQHKLIHAGLERLDDYVDQVRAGERELRLTGPAGLKGVLDSFGTVLWTHLDEEVVNLGADSMRRFWTREEMARLNF